ncbi:MAG: thioredoxin domain-containing protein [Candidatus Krumholzibacteriia bacterium]
MTSFREADRAGGHPLQCARPQRLLLIVDLPQGKHHPSRGDGNEEIGMFQHRRPGLRALAVVGMVGVIIGAAPRAGAAAPAGAPVAPTFGVVEGEKGAYLVGEVSRGDIVARFPAWNDSAAAYRPQPEAVARLAAVSRPVEIVCVLGTWCGDSRREVPRFWKILDLAANPNLRLRMFAVGRKDDAAALAAAAAAGAPRDIRAVWGVTLVPTFIFRAGDDAELGRIIETPTGTLEGDAAGIVAPAAPAADAPDRGGWH